MIAVLPIRDKTEIEVYFEKAGLKARGNSGCVAAKSGNEILGYCLYELCEKYINIVYITPKDNLPLSDGILRATLNMAVLRNVVNARYEGKTNEELFDKLGFILDKKDRKLDIGKLFSGCHSPK